jgi:hypothetical protein
MEVVKITHVYGHKATVTWRGKGRAPRLSGKLSEADRDQLEEHFQTPMDVVVLAGTEEEDRGKVVSVHPLDSPEAFMEAVGWLPSMGWLTE